jgi:hypothetical protein
VPTGRPLRLVREADQALLVIYPIHHESTGSPLVGFAISFPVSKKPTATEYVVNDIWRQQELEGPDDEDSDE